MKIFVKTFGCTFNKRDSEIIKGVLSTNQFEIVDSEEKADIIVVNSCGVKDQTQSKIIFYIESLNKPVYLGGCLPKILDLKNIKNVKGVFDTNTINNLPNQINGEIKELFSSKKLNKLELPVQQDSKDTLIIQISEGCLGDCNYCATKFARGKLKSYSISDIVNAIKGFKGTRVNLTSQDTGCYGFDIDTNLAKLLKVLINLPGQFKIRIGMMNPNHLINFKDEFLEVFKSNKIFKFVHLPVQAGNDEVLKAMNRKYKVKDFISLVKEIKENFFRVTIATDIIIGFPGETDEQHWDTLNLLRDLSPEVVNISKYWPRPKTKAAELKPLPTEVIKHRSKIITDICKNISSLQNERWLNWEGEVIIDEKGKEENQWIGRNSSYKSVIINGNYK